MKKKFVYLSTFLVVLICSFSAQAQYSKGDLLINPGISFGGYYSDYVGSYTGIPGLSANVEYNVTDNIAVGGYLGFVSRTYKGPGYKYGWTNIGFGARGVFHATEVLNDAFNGSMNSEKLDIYGGLSLGYETYTYNGDYSTYNYSTGGLVLGGILGCRYMFNPAIGVFGEVGRGAFGALTLGVTFKL